MAVRIGLDQYAYVNTGSEEVPTWTLVPKAKDVTLGLEAADIDASDRSSNWRGHLTGHLDATIDMEMNYDPADDAYQALLTVFTARGYIEVLILDGPVGTAGSQGLRAYCTVPNFSRNEPLEDAVTISVSFKPAYDATPTWHVVGA